MLHALADLNNSASGLMANDHWLVHHEAADVALQRQKSDDLKHSRHINGASEKKMTGRWPQQRQRT